MSTFKIKDKPNHDIVIAIKKYAQGQYGEDDLIIYSPSWCSTCGWSIEGHFLGFTKKEAIDDMKKKSENGTIDIQPFSLSENKPIGT